MCSRQNHPHLQWHREMNPEQKQTRHEWRHGGGEGRGRCCGNEGSGKEAEETQKRWNGIKSDGEKARKKETEADRETALFTVD